MRSFCALAALAAAVTPVHKVVELLQGMQVQGVDEKKAEAVQHSAYAQWCVDTEGQKEHAIEKYSMRKGELEAVISKAASDIATLSEQIETHHAEISSWQTDMKAASDVRGKEASDYQATATDYNESIDALKRAIATLKSEDFDREQAEALLQVTAAKTARLSALLGEEPDYMSRSAPAAHGYEFQSGGVLEMLYNLQNKFREESRKLHEEELATKHAHENVVQDLSDRIENAEATLTRRKKTLGARRSAKGAAKEEHASTMKLWKSDRRYLRDLQDQCRNKDEAFGVRQQTRADELAAIGQAIDIIKSHTVSGAADEHLPSFAQLRAGLLGADNQRLQRVADLFMDRGESLDSTMLSQLSARVGNDAFDKVRKMIRELVFKLKEEATAETEHHGWCQSELAANKIQRESKSADVEQLRAQSDKLNATIARLSQDVADLTQDIRELDHAVADATQQRHEESAANKKTVEEAGAAEAAVADAVVILKQFYEAQGVDNSFVQVRQTPSADAPDSFEGEYRGLQGENGGVLGMLEVIQSDWARLLAETKSSEAQGIEEHKTFVNDSAVDKAVKSTDIEHKLASRIERQQELRNTTTELHNTSEELDAANAYYQKLKPSCVDSDVSYQDRVKRREDEIQSLKEGLKILSGQM